MKLTFKAALVSAIFTTAATSGVCANAATITFDTTSCSNTIATCDNGSSINADLGSISGLSAVTYTNPYVVLPNNLQYWGLGYSNLPSVAWGGVNASSTGMRVNISPLNGYYIKLVSFDLAAFPTGTDRNTTLAVNFGDGTTWSAFAALGLPLTISGVNFTHYDLASTFGNGNPSLNGFQITWGNDGWNVGINNILYEVVDKNGNAVPLPGTLALILGGLVLVRVKRKTMI